MPNIPPVVLYAFGMILMVMGSLRAYHLGWRRRPDGPEGDDETDDSSEQATEGEAASLAREVDPDANDEPRPVTVRGVQPPAWARGSGGGYKRHLLMGLLWLGMGAFIVISTALGQR